MGTESTGIKTEHTGARLPDSDLFSPKTLQESVATPNLSVCMNEYMVVLGMEPRALYMLGKYLSPKLYPELHMAFHCIINI